MNLYYCETVAAVSRRWHLRYHDSDESRKLGGGANTPTLCGLQAAWDIDRAVHERDLEALGCRSCVATLKEDLGMGALIVNVESDPLREQDPVAYLKRKYFKMFATKNNAVYLLAEAEELGVPVKILPTNEVAIGEAEVKAAEER